MATPTMPHRNDPNTVKLNDDMATLGLSGAALGRVTGKNAATINRRRAGKTPTPAEAVAFTGLWVKLKAILQELEERARP
jgi:hypothetical protein